MDGYDLQNKVIQRLLSGSATAPEIAEALATTEAVVLPVLDQLRSDDVVEFMAGDWSLSDKFRSSIPKTGS